VADGIDDYPSIEIVFAEQRQQDANAKVKTFEDEVAEPENADEAKPNLLEAARRCVGHNQHQYS
jgi:hypothetical protein